MAKKYAAPELLQSGVYNTRKADTWAFGILLFVMTTGTFPYSSSNDTNVKRLVLAGRMASPEQIGFEFADLYAQLTCRSPQQRPTVAEILMSPCIVLRKGKGLKKSRRELELLLAKSRPYQAVQFIENHTDRN
jgi:serine/threonine protein kinase